jgi:hypothetical protein
MQRRTIVLTSSPGLVLLFVSSTALAQYQLTNLVSNQVGVAPHTGPLIVNAWGNGSCSRQPLVDQRQ